MEVIKLVQQVYRWLHGCSQIEGNSAISQCLARCPSLTKVLCGDCLYGCHSDEHIDGKSEKNKKAEGEADNSGPIGESVDGFVPEDELNKFISVSEGHFKVAILFLVHHGINCNLNAIIIMRYRQQLHIRMEQQRPSSNKYRKCVQNGQMRIRIKMQPKSLSLCVPLSWQVNKVKCILCNMMPKLEFGAIGLSHDNEEIPGHFTFEDILEQDDDAECFRKEQYVINFSRRENKPQQFQQYYSSKMLPVLHSVSKSPFQPLLHPKYYFLYNEILEIQMSGQHLKSNLQTILNLKNLLNLARNPAAPAAQAQPQAEANGENAQGGGGFGLGGNMLGLLPGNNRNIFEWLAFIVFKIFQIFILWQLIQIVLAYINKWHVFILVLIILVYFYIDYCQKQKLQNIPVANAPNPPNQNNQQQEQEQRENEKQNLENQPNETFTEQEIHHQTLLGQSSQNEGQKEQRQQLDGNKNGQDSSYQNEKNSQQVQNQQKGLDRQSNQSNPRGPIIKSFLKVVRGLCILAESTISFFMSLFPNWTIQLHFNIFRDKFNVIDSVIERIDNTVPVHCKQE